MTIKNITTNITITQKAKFARSLKDRTFGLLLNSNPRSLIFQTRFGIHTFGLKQPIDVLVIDNDLKVAQIKTSLKPNKFYFWNPKHQLIIELPQNSCQKVKINDQLKFE